MAIIAMLGSGEFEPWCRPVDEWCVARAAAPGGRVLIVPTASAPEGEDVFRNWASVGTEHYRALGLAPEVLEVHTRTDASDPALADVVAGAKLIFFSGGNPGYLAETFAGTPFWAAACDAVAREETALGGCSAGSVFLGINAPYVANEQLDHWVPGLALLSRAYVLPHFDALNSFAEGLREMLIRERPPGATIVGIDEHTAMYGDGDRWSVTGAGAAWIAEDGTGDLTEYREGDAVVAPLGLSLP